MVYSISDAVRGALDELTFLRTAIDYDLLNYSAVARFLQPAISKKLESEDISVDAIAIAVRRHVETAKLQSKQQQGKALDAVKAAKIILRTDMCMVEVQQWQNGFLDRLKSIVEQVDFVAGEKFYLIARSMSLFLICNSRFLPVIEEAALAPSRVASKAQHLSAITINVQHASFDSPGILQFFTQQFEMAGINIIDVFSTRGKITFIFNQKDAAKAYEKMSSAIEAVRALPL